MEHLIISSLHWPKNIEQEAFRHNYILKYTFSAFDIDDPFTLQLIASNDIDGIADFWVVVIKSF